MTWEVLTGDCVEVMRGMPDASVDAVVTDPPYDLTNRVPDVKKCRDCGRVCGGRDGNPAACPRCDGELYNQRSQGKGFMGKDWDGTGVAFCVETWAEVFRVLKPGGHLLAMGGTRTEHRMTCAIEDAGFEIRDKIAWIYGSGFPKSLNVSKAIDKAAGAEREVVGPSSRHGGRSTAYPKQVGKRSPEEYGCVTPQTVERATITAPATEAARQWDGWHTALKPAMEMVCVARKPLSEPTVCRNVLKHSTGAINVDGCRIGGEPRPVMVRTTTIVAATSMSGQSTGATSNGQKTTLGRWPANVVLGCACPGDAHEPGCTCYELDRQSGQLSTHPGMARRDYQPGLYGAPRREGTVLSRGDTGGASRFFYCAKSSRSERNAGLGSTCTVKYNLSQEEARLCAETVHLLERATSDIPTVKWLTGESGASITALCPSECLSTTLTAIRRIMTSLTSRWSMPSLTNASTAVVNYETANGGSPAASAGSSSPSVPNTTRENPAESAPGADHVASRMLSLISDEDAWKPATNIHSTVKPLSLMSWLCRLVTPPGGVILDPFCGSGSTGAAAAQLGFNFIGIDADADYCTIARQRINHWAGLNEEAA